MLEDERSRVDPTGHPEYGRLWDGHSTACTCAVLATSATVGVG
jgi:hypothetical protein